jgi:HprK-related kinase A
MGDVSVAAALQGHGLWLDVGVVQIRVRSRSRNLATALTEVYRHFPFDNAGPWADLHPEVRPRRRWWPGREQVEFVCDGARPFERFPADHALPMFEWGANWLIGQRTHHRLLMHAGTVERDGRALLMPGVPGAGKSTLTAALALSGWRLLSDEFAALDPGTGLLWPLIKPPALKNRSIDTLRHFRSAAELGRVYPDTPKGAVAHLAPPATAVARRHEAALPAMIVLPRWTEGAAARLEPVAPEMACSALAFNAFNYRLLGEDGFRAVVRLARELPAWQLVYSRLDEGLACLEGAWAQALSATAGSAAP